MKISVFTSNQPRHAALLRRLADVSDEVFGVQEVTTVFPGQVEDFYRRSPVMQDYFARVLAAEREVFGSLRPHPRNVRMVPVLMGDLNRLGEATAFIEEEVRTSDAVVVFGASWIRPPLVSALIDRRAVNIHMGVSPYYRGASCNFWCAYDGHMQFIGATIHRINRGLDSGDILFHALPRAEELDPFIMGMRAVDSAQMALAAAIADGSFAATEPVKQDRSQELRYSRRADFTDEVAAEYLRSLPTAADVGRALRTRRDEQFVRPRYC